jgi:hypothetical protein
MHIRPASACGALAFAVVVFLAAPRTTAVSPTSGPELEVKVVSNDPVVEWHQIFNAATLATVPVPSSLATSRSAALVSVSLFDAINGVHRRYAPYLVTERAPARTSANAAAIQAAYAVLLKLYPVQAPTLSARRDESIARVIEVETADRVELGLSWGQHVADAIWLARPE